MTSYFHNKHVWQVKSLKHLVDFAKIEVFLQSRDIFIEVSHPPGVLTMLKQVFFQNKGWALIMTGYDFFTLMTRFVTISSLLS